MSFRLVRKSVTLNDLEWRNGRYFALFHRIRVRCRRKRLPRSQNPSSDIFNMKRRAKANYMLALRQVDKENLCAVSNDLEECLLKKDHLSFWKTWNAKFSCKRNVPVCIDGFWSTVCKTVRPMLSVRCLSVCASLAIQHLWH